LTAALNTVGIIRVVLLHRGQELCEIEGCIARAAAGTGAALLIEGPAGVGKSALLQAARQSASTAGFEVLSARGGELEQAAAWAIVRELLDAATARLPTNDREALLGGPAAPAAVVLGERAVEEWSGSDQAFRIAHGLTWVVTALAQRAPLALLIDDLHWADTASVRWMSFLARRLDDLPVVLIAAARPATDGEHFLSELAVAARVVTPRSFDSGAVKDFVVARLGVTPAQQFTAACLELTGGNPFLLGELLREAARDGLEVDALSAERLRGSRPGSVARAVLVRLA
jgi:hypothetical protein